jgi:hypothetical protein
MGHDGSTSFISIAGNLLNGTTSQTMDNTFDEIEQTTKDSDGDKEFQAGEGSGTVTVEGRLNESATYGYSDLEAAAEAKAAVAVVYGRGIDIAGGEITSFSGIITGLSRSDPENGSITWTLNIRRTGSKTYGTSATTLI